jgi:hypothetical protein
MVRQASENDPARRPGGAVPAGPPPQDGEPGAAPPLLASWKNLYLLLLGELALLVLLFYALTRWAS